MTDKRHSPTKPSASPPVTPPGRRLVLDVVTAALDATGAAWAWQGEAGAPDRWAADTGAKDLDVWYADPLTVAGPVAALSSTFDCARVAEAADPRRLRHISLAVRTATGLAVVDVTYGDLLVGPVLLMPAGQITVEPGTHRLTGAAAMADLLVRPVLRGRLPGGPRLAAARDAWAAAEPDHRAGLAQRLTAQLGAGVAGELIGVAGGAAPDAGLPGRARRRLAVRSLAPGAAAATWAQRRTVLPAGAAAGPLGLRTRGVVVALVGTDGAGKSTVADGLRDRLHSYGITTSQAYFGMARGNLPGVALARRLFGVGSVAPAPAPAAAPAPAPAPAAAAPPADHPGLRRAAAWFYAAEYLWRYLHTVAPALARRQVVIADRWVYDLRESPWPGSPAARAVEFLVPAPDLLVLPDAPPDLIHARKPERGLADQAAQQHRFHRLLAEHPARVDELVVDTSGAAPDPLARLVVAVVQAAHGPRRRRR
ncbi:thymidylate kinase [Actinoplanes sp. NPDC049599]|uniref:thymidylate kinase n=1 Tax=Actinoplanes sp. NPDC049599 TaxID=3363903 RepID=UPI0037A2A3C4